MSLKEIFKKSIGNKNEVKLVYNKESKYTVEIRNLVKNMLYKVFIEENVIDKSFEEMKTSIPKIIGVLESDKSALRGSSMLGSINTVDDVFGYFVDYPSGDDFSFTQDDTALRSSLFMANLEASESIDAMNDRNKKILAALISDSSQAGFSLSFLDQGIKDAVNSKFKSIDTSSIEKNKRDYRSFFENYKNDDVSKLTLLQYGNSDKDYTISWAEYYTESINQQTNNSYSRYFLAILLSNPDGVLTIGESRGDSGNDPLKTAVDLFISKVTYPDFNDKKINMAIKDGVFSIPSGKVSANEWPKMSVTFNKDAYNDTKSKIQFVLDPFFKLSIAKLAAGDNAVNWTTGPIAKIFKGINSDRAFSTAGDSLRMPIKRLIQIFTISKTISFFKYVEWAKVQSGETSVDEASYKEYVPANLTEDQITVLQSKIGESSDYQKALIELLLFINGTKKTGLEFAKEVKKMYSGDEMLQKSLSERGWNILNYISSIDSNLDSSTLESGLQSIGATERTKEIAVRHYNGQRGKPVIRQEANESVFRVKNAILKESDIRRIIKRKILNEAYSYTNFDTTIRDLSALKSDEEIEKFWNDAETQEKKKIAKDFNKFTGKESISVSNAGTLSNGDFATVYKNDFKKAIEDKKKSKETNQTVAQGIVNGATASWDQFFPQNSTSVTDQNLKDINNFISWVLRAGNEVQKAQLSAGGINEKFSDTNSITDDNILVLKLVFDGGKEGDLDVDSAAPKYFIDKDVQAHWGFTIQPPSKTSLPQGDQSGEDTPSRGSIIKPKAPEVITKVNLKEAEVKYGKVGTFLRAAIQITDIEMTTIEESRVRSAIRKLLKEEEDSQSGSQNSKNEENAEPTAEEKRQVTIDAINTLTSADALGGTTWAIFCKFSSPETPYYAVCVDDPKNKFTGYGYSKVAMQFEQVANTIMGDWEELKAIGKTMLQVAIGDLILNSIEQNERNLTGGDRLNTEGLEESSWSTDTSDTGSLYYYEFADLLKRRQIDTDGPFGENMRIMKTAAKSRGQFTKALNSVFLINTNMKGILKSNPMSVIENVKEKSLDSYKEAIDTLHELCSQSGYRAGSSFSFYVAGKKGENYVFKPVNTADEKGVRILNNNHPDSDSAIASFLKDETLQGSSAITGSSLQGGMFEQKKVTIPASIDSYTDMMDGSNYGTIGIGFIEDTKSELGFKVLPPLNADQFLAVVTNYILGPGGKRRANKRALNAAVSSVAGEYKKYQNNYSNLINREVPQRLRTVRGKDGKYQTGRAADFNKEYKKVTSPQGIGKGKAEELKFFKYEANQFATLPKGVKPGKANIAQQYQTGTKRGMKSVTFEFLYAPGVPVMDPYSEFIQLLIKACTNENSAASTNLPNPKLFESLVNRHKLLYEIYLNNKAKENVKKRVKSLYKENLKKKIKALILEKYESGDVAVARKLGRGAFSGQPSSSRAQPPKREKQGEKKKEEQPKPPQAGPVEKVGDFNPQTFSDSMIPVSDKVNSLPWYHRMYKNKAGLVIDNKGGHNGTDFACPEGTDVRASGEGEVVYAGWENDSNHNAGAGLYIKIKHKDHFSLYFHLSELGKINGNDIKVGDKVKKGDVIGKSGQTGNATGPHLHYEVKPLNNKKSPDNQIAWIISKKDQLNFADGVEKDLEIIEKWYGAGENLKDGNKDNYFIVGDAASEPRENYNWKEGYYQDTPFVETQTQGQGQADGQGQPQGQGQADGQGQPQGQGQADGQGQAGVNEITVESAAQKLKEGNLEKTTIDGAEYKFSTLAIDTSAFAGGSLGLTLGATDADGDDVNDSVTIKKVLDYKLLLTDEQDVMSFYIILEMGNDYFVDNTITKTYIGDTVDGFEVMEVESYVIEPYEDFNDSNGTNRIKMGKTLIVVKIKGLSLLASNVSFNSFVKEKDKSKLQINIIKTPGN